MMSKYEKFTHYISLGHFCSVAMELERNGLRSASYPFDWLITPSFESVIRAIDCHFDGFLEYELLLQDKIQRQIYYNSRYQFSFVHDFSRYKSLSEQLEEVTAKYQRRIDRFYKDIEQPTLFIRYMYDGDSEKDGESPDILWTANNLDYIKTLIHSYNKDSDILYISDQTGGKEDADNNSFWVCKDPDDTCARKPFSKNTALNDYFSNVEFDNRERNLEIYRLKEQRKMRGYTRAVKKIMEGLSGLFLKEYIHDT